MIFMKNVMLSISLVLFFSCHNTSAMSSNNINEYGRAEQISDSILHQLQQSNEVVLAFAVENYAWVKSINYKIIALNNNQWKGYTYSINKTRGTASINPAEVSQDSCNAAWKFFQQTTVAKIKGDNGENFCEGEKKNSCNINDGATWRLLILTKNNVIDPAYYEPQFFEECCPGNKDRKLFLEAVDKINNAINEE